MWMWWRDDVLLTLMLLMMKSVQPKGEKIESVWRCCLGGEVLSLLCDVARSDLISIVIYVALLAIYWMAVNVKWFGMLDYVVREN